MNSSFTYENELNPLSIRAELVSNCKHPKKSCDVDPNGNRYCMDCNLDL